jgi:hypothetical protein
LGSERDRMFQNALFDSLWARFRATAPTALKVHEALEAINGRVVIDHVALRTLNVGPVPLAVLSRVLADIGFVAFDEYAHPGRPVYSVAFRPLKPGLPKIFLSELMVERLSVPSRRILQGLLEHADFPPALDERLFHSGVHWGAIDAASYSTLADESDYAAWFASQGFTPNHFTALVNDLPAIPSIDEVIELAQQMDVEISQVGGLIKGSALTGLQQAATEPERLEYLTSDRRVLQVPGSFYEFALRYPLADGKLYEGFLTQTTERHAEPGMRRRG